jgi:hypothetical protein
MTVQGKVLPFRLLATLEDGASFARRDDRGGLVVIDADRYWAAIRLSPRQPRNRPTHPPKPASQISPERLAGGCLLFRLPRCRCRPEEAGTCPDADPRCVKSCPDLL